jgi:hypothetical protein
MRTKVTLVLIFLNVALFFFIFYVEQRLETTRSLNDARRRVLDASAANIHRLEIAGLPEPVALERRGDDWRLTAPIDWPANPHAVRRILNELVFLEREASFSLEDLARNGQSLADYGLERPALTLTFTPAAPGGGPSDSLSPVVLRIGAETKAANRLYLLSPDGTRVLVVSRGLADSLKLSLGQLRANALFQIPVFEVRSLSVQAAATNNLRVRLRRDGNRWSLETPILARAGTASTELAINALTTLEVHEFVPAGSPDAGRTDLTSPTLRVTLEGNSRRETLLIGARVDPADAAPEPFYFARLEDRPAVFSVSIPETLITTLRQAQESLRERRILDLDGRVVTGLTLRAPGQPELNLRRLEASGPSADTSAWQIVRGDGGAGVQTLAADPSAVGRLLQHLGLLTAEEFKSDAPSAADLENWGFNQPVREVALTLALIGASPATPAPPPLVLQLGVAADRSDAVYARLAGQDYIYRVRASILPELPVVARTFRDKRIRELPAGAHITGLALVRIEDGSTLLSRSLADSQTWPEALAADTPALRNALETLLAQLRLVRAREIVATSFTPTVTLEGEDRPWRFRLDLTVALGRAPGAASSTINLFLSERTGGGTLLMGSPENEVVFAAEQALLDAVWALLQIGRDPGPPPAR